MPRCYKKKKIEIYSEEDLKDGNKLIKEENYPVAVITERFAIPDQTLRDQLNCKTKKLNRVFTETQEVRIKSVIQS